MHKKRRYTLRSHILLAEKIKKKISHLNDFKKDLAINLKRIEVCIEEHEKDLAQVQSTKELDIVVSRLTSLRNRMSNISDSLFCLDDFSKKSIKHQNMPLLDPCRKSTSKRNSREIEKEYVVEDILFS